MSIVDGGFRLWHAKGGQLTNEEPSYKVYRVKSDEFGILTPKWIFQSETFEIDENPKLVRNFDQVSSNAQNPREQLVDVRDSEEFSKVVDGVQNHIPNSFNVPYSDMFDKENGTLKSLDQLKQCNWTRVLEFRNSR